MRILLSESDLLTAGPRERGGGASPLLNPNSLVTARSGHGMLSWDI